MDAYRNGHHRAIHLHRDGDVDGVNEPAIARDGDRLILRPVKPIWGAFLQQKKAETGLLAERPDMSSDEGGVAL